MSRQDPNRRSYIVSPGFDNLYFIYSPLIALSLGVAGSFTPLATYRFFHHQKLESWMDIIAGVVTMSHLVIVFFRSHADERIFRLYPKRFIWAPILLFAAMALSSWMLVFVFVLAAWWDVYHSSLQTFGLGRIYDSRVGNPPDEGRRLDRILNLLLYAGPILAGVTLADHVVHFNRFEQVGSAFFTVVPVYAKTYQRYLTVTVWTLGTLFLAYYFYAYRQLANKGYRVSRQKIALLVSTAFCSITTWGFNSFGQAFFIMNLFHAVQYFAIVWWSEHQNMSKIFRMQEHAMGKRMTLVLFLSVALAYGIWAHTFAHLSHWGYSLLLTVSILHFWYDGFIWSVKRRQIPD